MSEQQALKSVEDMIAFLRDNFDRLEPGTIEHKCCGCGGAVMLREKTDGEIYCNIFCWQASRKGKTL